MDEMLVGLGIRQHDADSLIKIHDCSISIGKSFIENSICYIKYGSTLFNYVENGLWEKCTKLAFTHGGHNL